MIKIILALWKNTRKQTSSQNKRTKAKTTSKIERNKLGA